MYIVQDDNEIIRRVLLGDRQAYAQLVKQYQNLVFSIALRYTQNREDAEEIAQDIFIKVYRSLADFRANSKFSTWLYTIAANTSITFLRKKKLPVHSLDNEKIFHLADTRNAATAVADIERGSHVTLVNKAIQLLSPDDATVITLFYKAEQSIEEIGKITGLTPNAVKVKLHRARKRLKEKMEMHFKSELKEIIN